MAKSKIVKNEVAEPVASRATAGKLNESTAAINKALDGLSPVEQTRVLRAVCVLLDLDLELPEPEAPPKSRPPSGGPYGMGHLSR